MPKPDDHHQQGAGLTYKIKAVASPHPQKDYQEDISNNFYDAIHSKLHAAALDILGQAARDFDSLKNKYAGLDRVKADKLDQRILNELIRAAGRDAMRNLFSIPVKPTEQPLSLQRSYLRNGPGAAHLYIIDWLYSLAPVTIPAGQIEDITQPTRKKHKGKYLYATIERTPLFYRNLSNHIYLVTQERKSKRTLRRYLTAYCKTLVFKNFDIGSKKALLAVGYYKQHRTDRGAKYYRKYTLTTARETAIKWRNIHKYLRPKYGKERKKI